MKMQNYVCDGKFRGNVLVVVRTGCEKTYFVQKLALNNFFRRLLKEKLVSYISINKTRKAEI